MGRAGEELSRQAAVAAAMQWYDAEGPEKIGFERGQYRIKQPVLAAYRNNDTEWSIRYMTEPDCGLEGFIRMTYQRTGGRWRATSGLFEGASQKLDLEGRPARPGGTRWRRSVARHEYRQM
jgi:hypothetical protein